MRWPEAQALISEAHKLGYRGTEWERAMVARLELMQPKFLRSDDAASLTEFYRRASGGGKFERHQVINCKYRYNPE